MVDINVSSLNARGLRDGNKRREIFRWLKRYHKAEHNFTFIQESHSIESDEDVWKKEWGSNIIFSHGNNNAKGVAILFPTHVSNIIVHEQWADENGRICMVKLKIENDMLCLINIYAPTKNVQSLQLDFLEKLQELVYRHEESSFVIAGDFNTYLDPLLDKDGGTIESMSNYASKLQHFAENYNLVDVWRVHNPATKRYTWRQNKPLVQSRLDFILISLNLMQNVKSCDIKPSIKTDHSLVQITISLNTLQMRGPGFWKFNSALTKDEVYIDYIKEIIQQLKLDCQNMEDKGLKWDYIKSEIRQRTITYSKTQARLRRTLEDELKTRYNNLATQFEETKDPYTLTLLENTKTEIEQINKEKVAGSQIRSRAIILDAQKGASFYSNLEIF